MLSRAFSNVQKLRLLFDPIGNCLKICRRFIRYSNTYCWEVYRTRFLNIFIYLRHYAAYKYAQTLVQLFACRMTYNAVIFPLVAPYFNAS